MSRALLLLALTVHVAHAENPKLDEARAAIADVRYDDAQRLLVEALRQGTNRADELGEIYQLSAAAAVVLGQPELAQMYYRRMLAISPSAELAADASPRFREPFVAAQAFMAAQPRFALRAVPKVGAIEVTITDALRMASAVVAWRAGVVISTVKYAGEAVVLPTTAVDAIAVVDEHGNELRTLEGVISSLQPPSPPASSSVSRPFLQRWSTWAVPAGVFTGVGVSFLIAGQLSKNRLDRILANSQNYYFDDAEAARTSWRRSSQIMTISLTLAGGCAVVAAVMAFAQPDSQTRLAGVIGRDAAVVTLTGPL